MDSNNVKNDASADDDAAAAPIGAHQQPQIPPPERFNPTEDNWEIYQERLEQYMVGQAIVKPDLKKAMLISVIGNVAYADLRNMCAPNSVNSKSYDELCALLKPQYSEPVVVHFARKRFYTESKMANEPIQQLLLRIKGLAAPCAFGASYGNILRDKIISLQEGRSFDRICEEDETLTLEQAIKIITRVEGQVKMKEQAGEVFALQYRGNPPPNSTHQEGHQRITARLGARPNGVQRPTMDHAKKTASGRRIRCIHCGGTNHVHRECLHKSATCYVCQQAGHIASICPRKRTHFIAKSKAAKPPQNNKAAQQDRYNNDSDDTCLELNDAFDLGSDSSSEVRINNINRNCAESYHYDVQLSVNGTPLEFQVDTGAAISAISVQQYKNELKHVPMEKTTMKIFGYTGEPLHIAGVVRAEVKLNKITTFGKIYIVHQGGPPILGRNLLNKLGFAYTFEKEAKVTVHKLSNEDAIAEQIYSEFAMLFDGKLGTYNKKEFSLDLKPGSVAKFVRARPVPFAFQKQYDEEFDTLEKLGVITRTDSSDWGTPVVPVLKPNGKIRICGDYKTTLNPNLVEVKYPLPRVSELFAKLKGGQLYTKLDLSRGYNQLVLSEESRKLVALSTHRGVYLMNRLPFGISPACGIFQREIENLLEGIPYVVVFIDDILITGTTDETHKQNIKRVLKRLQKAGLKLEKSKCEFFKQEITYLGHTITNAGVKKCKAKVEALTNAPTPTNVPEIRAFCGLANYYGKFVNGMASTLSPLYRLLRKDVKFDWSDECEQAFKQIKASIMSDNVLCHFDPELPVVLSCDASNRGIGAVLSHRIGRDLKPIAFASRTLSAAESNYSTIHKEGLAIIFGIKKYYQYLIGRQFILQTDHKPLIAIFKPSNGIPVMAAGRVQRWAVYLSGFDYTIEYVKSDNNVSDLFSRLPLPYDGLNSELDEEKAYLHFMREHFPCKTITHADIRRESRNDIEISTISNAVKTNQVRAAIANRPEFKTFLGKEEELSVERDILMWGGRVVIPQKLRENMMQSVHSTHMGIVKTKSLCRSHFWWPNLDKDIEAMIKACEQCCQLLPDPGKTQLIPWRSENRPWSRIHLDYAGPIKGVYLLIVVDAFSKWIEVFVTKNPNAQFTMEKIYESMCRYGLPDTIVSDNGVQFKNGEFDQFTTQFDIKHIFTAPGYPATNGQAESAVKLVKKGIKAVLISQPTRELKGIINQFLFDYRTTPHTATLESPAKLFLNRECRNRFSLIRPPTTVETIEKNQRKQVQHHRGQQPREMLEGSRVWSRDYTNPNIKAWTLGRIRKILGRRNFLIQLDKSDRLIKRHIDQIRSAPISMRAQVSSEGDDDGQRERDLERERRGADNQEIIAQPENPHPKINADNTNTETSASVETAIVEPSHSPRQAEGVIPESSPHHRSTRVRRKPDRLMY